MLCGPLTKNDIKTTQIFLDLTVTVIFWNGHVFLSEIINIIASFGRRWTTGMCYIVVLLGCSIVGVMQLGGDSLFWSRDFLWN